MILFEQRAISLVSMLVEWTAARWQPQLAPKRILYRTTATSQPASSILRRWRAALKHLHERMTYIASDSCLKINTIDLGKLLSLSMHSYALIYGPNWRLVIMGDW